MSNVKKPTKPKFVRNAPTVNKVLLGQAFKQEWPLLWAYMSETAYEDGSNRQTATLLLVLDPDGLKGCLNDRAEARSLWATGMDYTDVLTSLDDMLGSDDPHWRYHRKT